MHYKQLALPLPPYDAVMAALNHAPDVDDSMLREAGIWHGHHFPELTQLLESTLPLGQIHVDDIRSAVVEYEQPSPADSQPMSGITPPKLGNNFLDTSLLHFASFGQPPFGANGLDPEEDQDHTTISPPRSPASYHEEPDKEEDDSEEKSSSAGPIRRRRQQRHHFEGKPGICPTAFTPEQNDWIKAQGDAKRDMRLKKTWGDIAKSYRAVFKETRESKQLSTRYHDHLDESYSHEPISDEKFKEVLKKMTVNGSRPWTKLAHSITLSDGLPPTPNALKNRFCMYVNQKVVTVNGDKYVFTPKK